MKCRTATRRISPSFDGRLPERERRELLGHLERCPKCALQAHQLANLRGSLRDLPVRPVPDTLTTSLRVLASRERLQRTRQANLGASVEYWLDILRLWLNNLMRPVAVPFAGGLLSAVFLFTMLAPMYAKIDGPMIEDVPTTLTQPAALKSSLYMYVPIDGEIVVDLLVDGQGRLITYSIPQGQTWATNLELRRCIENTLLCTQFQPATMFGMPKPGKLRITLRRNQVDVQG